jgi:hypothetical protein
VRAEKERVHGNEQPFFSFFDLRVSSRQNAEQILARAVPKAQQIRRQLSRLPVERVFYLWIKRLLLFSNGHMR